MCDVPIIAAYCVESIEFFPGMIYKYSLEFLTVPVAPIIYRYNQTYYNSTQASLGISRIK
jgi:hypothetical protein